MRIIARRTLKNFVESLAGHKDQHAVKAALDGWYHQVRRASWKTSADVKRSFANASIITAERVVFDIKGHGYRLITAIDFEFGVVWIKWIGAHRDYDRIDARKVEYEK